MCCVWHGTGESSPRRANIARARHPPATIAVGVRTDTDPACERKAPRRPRQHTYRAAQRPFLGPSPPQHVAAAVGLSTNQQGLYRAKDAVTGSWRHQNGVVGSGSWTFGAREQLDRIEVLGSEGAITFSVFGELPLELRGRRNETIFIENPEHIQHFHVANMQRHLAGEAEHPSTGESAAHTAWVMEKILGGL